MGWDWIFVVIAFALVPILGYRWTADRTRAKAVSPNSRAALGPALADWLASTRELAARLQDLEISIKTLGAQEIERKKRGLGRPVAFEVDDANLFQEVEQVVALSRTWAEVGQSLRASILAEVGHALDVPPAGFTIAWTIELRQSGDRIAELQTALAQCREASAVLQSIDDALSAVAR